ncbi:MAG TPA: hypothetical protein PLT50_00530 [bacterium]|nr:hypothetical protein [bacterium]
MFRLLGRKAELYRYKITYLEDEIEIQENCISEEHKNEIEQMLKDKKLSFETQEIDQANNEWFNGLEFKSYDEALEVFNLGEQEYMKRKERLLLIDNLKLRADIDFIAIMSEVEL